MQAKNYKINEDVNSFLFATVGKYLRFRYGLDCADRSAIEDTAPPYLVIAHHVSSFDAFFISASIGSPVQYLASDSIFRNPLMRLLLSLVGAIPKAKFRSDRNVIRNLLAIRDRGGRIGVFPEGQSTWDGVNQPFLLSTGKLVKLLRIPVISAKIHGAYHIKPRWSASKRRGRVEIEFSKLLSKDETGTLSVAEINDRIAAALAYNVWDRQRAAERAFSGPKPAERLERTVYACPDCDSIGTLRSKGDRLACTACSLSLRIDDRGFFSAGSGPFRFRDLREWNLWQADRLKRLLDAGMEGEEVTGLLEDSRVSLMAGERTKRLKALGTGTLTLTGDGLAFFGPGDPIRFDLADMQGINVQPGEYLELFARGTLWRFGFPVTVSAYKWFVAINYLRLRLGYAEKGIFYGDALATGL